MVSQKYKSLLILYGSTGGFSEKVSFELADLIESKIPNIDVRLKPLSKIDPETPDVLNSLTIFVFPTYSGGKPNRESKLFFDWLKDAIKDFRVNKSIFSSVTFSVIAVGDTAYGHQYNVAGIKLSRYMALLGGKRLSKPFLLDVSKTYRTQFEYFADDFSQKILLAKNHPKDEENDFSAISSTSESEENTNGLADVEETPACSPPQSSKNEDNSERHVSTKKSEMITPVLRKNLEKQGYKLIGTHSGVKLCRWTKAMLRGRGGCYKHSFYGISSYQCMEMTPNLACANKCVFCWRHHTNPVGTEWRWEMEDPVEILEGAIDKHRKMMKANKGVPGVEEERLKDAMNVRHCALSLVGEPIMFFDFTNAQFPDQMKKLCKVTQLYLSIDASTKDALKAIGRPLFRDFWERFLQCIDLLKENKQRTVFRLTLVKDYNMENIENYANLVRRGEPSFIEIKGVTFSGDSKDAKIHMKNVPFHTEVMNFAKIFVEKISDMYEISCEHAHSCCVLISHKKFKKNGRWHTWIDYDKFNELVLSEKNFGPEDYIAETPGWAVVGAEEQGFDPGQTRFYRKGKDVSIKKRLEAEMKSRSEIVKDV